MTALECKKTVPACNRCTGHCCSRFLLKEGMVDLLTDPDGNGQDAAQIRDMVVLLHWHDKGGGVFTCRHFDAESRNCTIYEDRPKMCREYPYEKQCTFDGCTLTSTKEATNEPQPESKDAV